MNSFRFYLPTEVVFGKETEDQLPELTKKYGGSRVLVVTGGGSVERSGLLGKVEKMLEDAGIYHECFKGAKPNPTLDHALKGIAQAIEMEADFFLGVGGGSAIDTAKAISIGAANPETDLWDFHMGKPVTRNFPVGCILTIPASGTEMSNASVLLNTETGRKKSTLTDLNRPAFAIVNPEFGQTLPPFQMGCGVVDTMMHTLDRYFYPGAEENETTMQLAEAVLRVTVENGRKLLADPSDFDALTEIYWCSSLSQNGITGLGTAPRTVPAHPLGHELSAKFGSAHGATLSVVWPAWARYIYKDVPALFARYAVNVMGVEPSESDEETALKGIEKTEEFFRQIHMPLTFTELGVEVQDDEMIERLADGATFGGQVALGELRPVDKEDCRKIYAMVNR